jgi:NAD(P)-dependent dehydrogenase (short-subunit alcohol dehydrogenase family)
MTNVVVVVGAGQIAQAIARRVGVGKHVLLADMRPENAGSSAGRAGTPDEVGNVGALLMGPDGGFITGSEILMDGGVTASYWYGELAPK